MRAFRRGHAQDRGKPWRLASRPIDRPSSSARVRTTRPPIFAMAKWFEALDAAPVHASQLEEWAHEQYFHDGAHLPTRSSSLAGLDPAIRAGASSRREAAPRHGIAGSSSSARAGDAAAEAAADVYFPMAGGDSGVSDAPSSTSCRSNISPAKPRARRTCRSSTLTIPKRQEVNFRQIFKLGPGRREERRPPDGLRSSPRYAPAGRPSSGWSSSARSRRGARLSRRGVSTGCSISRAVGGQDPQRQTASTR